MSIRFGFHSWRWGFWFRVFGYGASFELFRRMPPLFSERNGYRRALRFGPIRIEGLKP